MQAMELAQRHGWTDERIVAARPYAPAGRLGTADSSAACSPAGRMSPSWPSATG